MHPRIQPATRADIEAFYGPEFKWTFRALAAILDGETLGVGGIYYDGPLIVVFSSAKDGAIEKYPFTAARMAKKVMGLVNLRAVCMGQASDKYPGVPLLERLGFKHVSGRVYKWNPTQ